MIHHPPFKECNRSVESLLLPSGRWMRFIKCIAGAVKVARKCSRASFLCHLFFIIILSKHSEQLSWWSAASVEKTLFHPQLASYAASSFVLWWRGRGISWNPDTVSDGGLVIWSFGRPQHCCHWSWFPLTLFFCWWKLNWFEKHFHWPRNQKWWSPRRAPGFANIQSICDPKYVTNVLCSPNAKI